MPGPLFYLAGMVAISLGAIVFSKEEKTRPELSTQRPVLRLKGSHVGRKILVIGSTGSGKTSMINVLAGSSLPVGAIESTTRSFHAVVWPGWEVCLVDTPGLQEIGTSRDYETLLEEYCRRYVDDIDTIAMVLKADVKSYAAQHAVAQKLQRGMPKVRLRIILTGADLMKPTRARTLDQEKQRHILDKRIEVARQFETPLRHVVSAVFARDEPDFGYGLSAVRNLLRRES